MICLPEYYKVVVATASTTLTAATTGVIQNVCLKNANRAYILCVIDHSGGEAGVLQPEMSTTESATATAITTAVQIWSLDSIAGDTWTRETDATSYTLTADSNDCAVLFGVDPATLVTTTAGSASTFYDWLGIYVSSAGSSSPMAVTYFLDSRYKQANPPTAIV